jgi:hypothetical protein
VLAEKDAIMSKEMEAISRKYFQFSILTDF